MKSPAVIAGRKQVSPDATPIAIAGHGPRIFATEVADPLEINAMLIMLEERRWLVASFDLLYIGGVLRRRLLSQLSARFGLEERDVFLFATHTHFAPPTDPLLPELGPYDAPYCELLERATLDLVADLIEHDPTVIRVDVRQGVLSHSVNRRRPRIAPSFTRSSGLSFSRVSFAPFPQGQRDDVATVITLTSNSTGTPLAVLWHWSCHPVGHTPSHVVSADFPGAVRDQLRRVYDRSLPVLYVQGFCGDVRPNLPPQRSARRRDRAIDLIRELIAGTPNMHSNAQAWQVWVRSLADEVVRISAGRPIFTDDNVDFLSADEVIYLKDIFDGSLRIGEMAVRGLRIGRRLQILAFGAEPSAGWKERISSNSPFDGIRLYAGYCGDVFGYLPLPEQVDEGGYEVLNFQTAFGMRGQFRKDSMLENVNAAVKSVTDAL